MKTAAVAASVALLGFAGAAHGARTPPCRTADLHIWVTRSAAALGTVGGYLAFTNRGRSTCMVRGWPTLIAVRPGASTTAVHVRETMFGPYTYVHGIARHVRGVPTVTLRHGQSAVAAFTAGDHGRTSAPCPPSWRQLRVSPPGDESSAIVSPWIAWYAHDLPSCTGIEVSMLVPASDLPPRR